RLTHLHRGFPPKPLAGRALREPGEMTMCSMPLSKQNCTGAWERILVENFMLRNGTKAATIATALPIILAAWSAFYFGSPAIHLPVVSQALFPRLRKFSRCWLQFSYREDSPSPLPKCRFRGLGQGNPYKIHGHSLRLL